MFSILKAISKKLDKLSLRLEKLKIAEYIYYLEHPKKMLFANFIGGLARGFGIAIGFTLLGALAIYLLQAAMRWNLPLISRFIEKIIEIVQQNLKGKS